MEENNKSEKEMNNSQKNDNDNFKVICPFCGSNIVIILDYKKIESISSDWLCFVCGNVFEFQRNKIR